MSTALAALQGSSSRQQGEGMHLETVSAVGDASCASGAHAAMCAGAEHRALWGVVKSAMLEGHYRDNTA